MARKMDPVAYVILKDETIHVAQGAGMPGEGCRATDILQTLPAAVPPKKLGADIRRALAAFSVPRTLKELEEYPDLVHRLAGGADKAAAYEKTMGVAMILPSSASGKIRIMSYAGDDLVGPSSRTVALNCSDKELGAEALVAVRGALEQLLKSPPAPTKPTLVAGAATEDPSGVIYLKGDSIHFIAEGILKHNGGIGMHKLVATLPSAATPAKLAAALRKTTKAFAKVKSDKTWDYDAVVASLAGGPDKIAEFRQNLGVVTFYLSVDEDEFRLAARDLKEGWIGKDEALPAKSDDAALSEAITKLLQRSLKKNSPRPAGPKSVPARDPREKGLAADLDKLGFFALADDPAELYERVKAEGDIAVMSLATNRCFLADAEDLAEGGVAAMIAEMAPFFAEMKLALPEAEDDMQDDAYRVLIDGAAHPILTPADFKKEDKGKPGYLWGIAGYRAAQALNDILKQRGAAERVYGIDGGNQMQFFVITPAMHKVITSQKGYEPADGPYLITDKYPHFGSTPRR